MTQGRAGVASGTKRVARVEENTAADSVESSDAQIETLNNLTPARGAPQRRTDGDVRALSSVRTEGELHADRHVEQRRRDADPGLRGVPGARRSDRTGRRPGARYRVPAHRHRRVLSKRRGGRTRRCRQRRPTRRAVRHHQAVDGARRLRRDPGRLPDDRWTASAWTTSTSTSSTSPSTTTTAPGEPWRNCSSRAGSVPSACPTSSPTDWST